MWVAGREGATTNPFLLNVAFYKLEKIRRAKGTRVKCAITFRSMKAPTKKLPTKAINVPLRTPSESRCLCSRCLGHGSPGITTAVYAAKTIDSVLKADQ